MDNVFIGMNTSVMYGVRIGENTIIGANSFVGHDLEGGYVWAGIPVKKICTFSDFVKKRKYSSFVEIQKSQTLSTKEIQNIWNEFNQRHYN